MKSNKSLENTLDKIHGIFRVHKIKISDGGGLSKRIAHNLRESISDNVDKSRIELDEVYGATTRQEIYAKIHQRWNKATTRRSDNVGVLEVLITTTGKLPKGKEEDFLTDSAEQLKQLYGEENLINYVVHRDEKETHIHAFVVPLEEKKVEKTRLTNQEEELLKAELKKRKIEFQTVPKKPAKDCKDERTWNDFKKQKKEYEQYKQKIKPILEELGISKTETVLSCQKICGDKQTMSHYQDIFFNNVFKKYGLDRGEKLGKTKKMSPTSLKKWQEKLEQKEAELETKEQNILDSALQKYAEKLSANDLLNSIQATEPGRKESAKEYQLRVIGYVDSVINGAKTYKKKCDAELKKEKEKMTEHNNEFIRGVMAENVQLKNENEKLKKIIDNEPKNVLDTPGLKQQIAKLDKIVKHWQSLSAEQLRQKAIEKEEKLGKKKSHFSR